MQREFPPASFSLVLGLSTAIGTFAGALGPGLIGLIRAPPAITAQRSWSAWR